ncbi:ABC transporter ATP-binding protein [Sinorhizobium fredii]|uniref:ABC transporter ATP-binding protein n=1 Tax=Rhizobium fredii TaxID=380 RepID=UPI0004B84A85|nr:ABC transporter ATP-binding protein [Sinorhizobium fredii]ASY73828.1 ATP-binding protein of ABC transporter [Sinorhizobium fredii CCBAU 83666]
MSGNVKDCGSLPAIQIKNIKKFYGAVEVLRGINLTVPQGSYTTFLGPSGSGKTTLLKIIAGFSSVSTGSVSISGVDVTHCAARAREVGIVFQNYALFPHLTARENVEYPLKVRKVPSGERRRRALEFLERVQLSQWSDRYPRELSGGQQQRVALARSLVYSPKLLLLDEPLSALDKHLRGHMQEFLKDLQRSLGISFVHVTHDQTEALALSSQVVIMRDGRLEQVGSPEEIYREPTSRFVADFIGNSNIVECQIGPRNGRHATIKLGEARTIGVPMPASAAEKLAGGARPLLLLRPENAGASLQGDESVVAMSGPVSRTTFMGTHYEVVFDTPQGEITAHLNKDYARGQAVHVAWRAEDTVLLAAGDGR